MSIGTEISIRFWWGLACWAPFHRPPVKLVLVRCEPCAVRNADPDTKESKSTFAWRESPVLLEDYWKCCEERVQNGVDDGNVHCEEKHDWFSHEEDCSYRSSTDMPV